MNRETRLRIALGLNIVIVVVQVVAGFAASSLSLLADAGHNLTDVAAVVISIIAVRLARRPATPQRSFGWHRSNILAAQANAAMLLIIGGLIVFESISRLRDPEPVHTGIVIAIAAIALFVNSGAAFILHEPGSRDLNMGSAVLHMMGDALASAGVLLAALVMSVVDGAYWLDPATSIVISVLIGWRAVKLLGETANVLLESTPAGMNTEELVSAMASIEGVESVHDLHVWSLSSDIHAMAAHLVLEGYPTLEEAQVVGGRVKVRLAHEFAIVHATLELECEPCATEADPCIDTDSMAAAPRPHHH